MYNQSQGIYIAICINSMVDGSTRADPVKKANVYLEHTVKQDAIKCHRGCDKNMDIFIPKVKPKCLSLSGIVQFGSVFVNINS